MQEQQYKNIKTILLTLHSSFSMPGSPSSPQCCVWSQSTKKKNNCEQKNLKAKPCLPSERRKMLKEVGHMHDFSACIHPFLGALSLYISHISISLHTLAFWLLFFFVMSALLATSIFPPPVARTSLLPTRPRICVLHILTDDQKNEVHISVVEF